MLANKLKLNPDKREFILIGSKTTVNNSFLTSQSIYLVIRSHQHKVSRSSELCSILISLVSQIVKSTRVHASDLYKILPLLDLNTSVLLAIALVSSILEYCNSLFVSLTDFELRRLQWVQNSLCRVVTCSPKFSHVTPQLKKLHWLPVKHRVQL